MAALAFFALGVALGAAFARSHYCFMGALTDIALFGQQRRARIWAAAAGLTTIVVFGLHHGGAPLGPGVGLAAWGAWPGVLVAAFVFGVGMTLAGGCPLRLLARIGGGDGAALIAFATATALACVVTAAKALGAPTPAGAEPGGVDPWSLAAAAAAILYAAIDPRLRRFDDEARLALILTACAVAGFVFWGAYGGAPSWSAALDSVGGAARALSNGAGGAAPIALALPIGVVAGSFATNGARGGFRPSGPPNRKALERALMGGGAIGLGVGVMGGDAFSIGVAGLAGRGLEALALVATMAAGVAATLRYFEKGSLRAWFSFER